MAYKRGVSTVLGYFIVFPCTRHCCSNVACAPPYVRSGYKLPYKIVRIYSCTHSHITLYMCTCMLTHTCIYILNIYIHRCLAQGLLPHHTASCTDLLRSNVAASVKNVLTLQLLYLGLPQLLASLCSGLICFILVCCESFSPTCIYRLPFPYKDVA